MNTTGAFNGEIRMLSSVPRCYVRQKSELTSFIEVNRQFGKFSYRSSLVCECTDGQNVRHSGAVVVDSTSGVVTGYIIRCKGCAEKAGKEVNHDANS